MKRSTTPSYIAQYRLLCTPDDGKVIGHCLFLGCKTYNIMVGEANKRLNSYYRDKEVNAIRMKQRKKGYELSDAEKDILKAKRKQYGLSEYAFQVYLKVHGKQISNFLDANTVQKIASQAWKGVSSVLFGKGKRLHYKKVEEFRSLEGKTNRQGIRYDTKKGCLIWGSRRIPIQVRGNDKWAQRALSDRVKYCRVVAKWHKTHWEYYLQLVLEGTSPTMAKPMSPNAEVGIDLGTSTVAITYDKKLDLRELGGEVNDIEAEIARLDRKLDRQRRASNPQNYDKLGRIKRLKKGERREWHYSQGYYKTFYLRRTLYAKRQAKLKQFHERLAEEVLSMGNQINVERMSMAGLSKRSKKTKINPKMGRPYSKKRFGKSIANHAPSMFIEALTRKGKARGATVTRYDPKPIKASQYDHTDGSNKKAPLSQREKTLSNGDKVQRDLYSAFLMKCLNADGTISQYKCNRFYPEFKRMHDELLAELRRQKAGGKKFPSCMGV